MEWVQMNCCRLGLNETILEIVRPGSLGSWEKIVRNGDGDCAEQERSF